MTTLSALLDELKQAKTGSRRLDAAIGLASGHYLLLFGGKIVDTSDHNRLMVCRAADAPPFTADEASAALAACLSLRHYTTSLDAAIPGENIIGTELLDSGWKAYQALTKHSHVTGHHPTSEPLARRIAALSALL